MESQIAQETLHNNNKRKEDDLPAHEDTKRAKIPETIPTHPVPIVQPPPTHDSSPFAVLLCNTKVESVWTRECKIFFAKRTDKVKDVFKGLIAHNFLSCPVVQKTKNRWYGFLDIANIVKFVVQHFEEATLINHTSIPQLLEEADNFKSLEVNNIIKNPAGILTPYHPIFKGYSLFAAYEVMARANLHRLAIVDHNRELVSVITQSQMVHFTHTNIALLGAKRSKLVKDMPYNLHEVYHVKPTDIALKAFSMLSEKNVYGIAVIDNDGNLEDQISMRDLKAMAPDGKLFWRLFKPVSEFLENVKKSRTDAHATERPKQLVTVTPNDTLETVMGLMVLHSIHRVYIVESANHKKPIGVISLRDVMLEAMPGGHW